MTTKGVKFGHYELVKRIARGGMAEIFLAIEHNIEGVRRQVVVKRVLPQMLESDDFITMFMDEARLAARLSHPNVAHVYNFGEVQGIYFLAMEYVDGLTVSKLIRLMGEQRIPLAITLRIMADACAGLHYAHELKDEKGKRLGVVHRDVSPQNIMVSRVGVAKLLDFGVAHASTQVHHTAVGQLKGKLAYMSPEQFRGDTVDPRADVFAAGVVLYEMIAGKPLFRRENEAATMHALIYDDPPSVSDFGAPPELDAIIQKACQKDVNERYQTCEEMQEALEELAVESGRVVTGKMLGRFIEEGMARIAEAKAKIKKEKPIPDRTPSHISLAGLASSPPKVPPPPIELGPPAGVRPQADSQAPTKPPPVPPPIPAPDRSPAPPAPMASPAPPAAAMPAPPTEIPAGRPSSSSMSTPGPASFAAPKERSRGLLIGMVGVLILLVLTVGAVVIWQLASDSEEEEEQQAALTSDTTSDGQEISPNTEPTKTTPAPTPNPADQSPPPVAAGADAGAATPPQKTLAADAGGAAADAGGAAPGDDAQEEPQEERNDDEGRDERRPERRFGSLFLNTTPWSKVRLGGRLLGTTPIVNARVPAGNHTLRLTDAEGNNHTKRVQIRPNQPTKLYINLRARGN